MDAPGIREELRDMARRLATAGYAVLLPNLYYRAGRRQRLRPRRAGQGTAPSTPAMRAIRTGMTIPPVMQDVAALLDYVDGQDFVADGPVGCHGYCMSGPYALAAAARYPDRVAAAASFYGTWLVNDVEESPHRSLGRVGGELYIACAEHDDLAPPDMVAETTAPVRCLGRCRRAGNLPRGASRLRLPRALVLRQARRRTPLGTPPGPLRPPVERSPPC